MSGIEATLEQKEQLKNVLRGRVNKPMMRRLISRNSDVPLKDLRLNPFTKDVEITDAACKHIHLEIMLLEKEYLKDSNLEILEDSELLKEGDKLIYFYKGEFTNYKYLSSIDDGEYHVLLNEDIYPPRTSEIISENNLFNYEWYKVKEGKSISQKFYYQRMLDYWENKAKKEINYYREELENYVKFNKGK
jgi:hypothetical protein